jgi:hypothetical protein
VSFLSTADNRTNILEAIVADGYMMAQVVYKVLLSGGQVAGHRLQDCFRNTTKAPRHPTRHSRESGERESTTAKRLVYGEDLYRTAGRYPSLVSNSGKSAVMRTSSSWLNRLVEAGFALERFGEPYPGDEPVRERPGLQDAQVVAYYLHVRARKPAETLGCHPTSLP